MASKMEAGQIEIDLSGDSYTLKATPKAARMISTKLGAIQEIFPRLELVDYSTIEWVILSGLSWMTDAEKKGVPDKIYYAGMMNLVIPCSNFITLIANGGRELDDIEDDAEEAAANGSGEAKGV